jgi:glycosyltransferase involved in cell wall biosynthesis
MRALPGITIITPCLNAAATISQAIESVATQAYGGPLEHLVIDGGSTDGTLDIVRGAGVRYISEPDRGLSHALNKGLKQAQHEILGQLNADDFYLPGALEAVGDAFAAHPAGEWLAGRCVIVDGKGRETRAWVSHYKDALLRHWSFPLHLTQNFVSCPSAFVRTEALRQLGGYDERYLASMDYDLWLRLGRRGPPIVLERRLAAYRRAGNTLSLTGFENQFREHARNAVEHGAGHPLAVATNRAASRAIVLAYRLQRARQRRRPA